MRMFVALMGLMLSVFSFAAEPTPTASVKEGIDYIVLGEPVRPTDPTKIEVSEIFSYACSHCAKFEPLLSSWAKKQQPDVALVQTHASFNPSWSIYQRGYYTVLALGVKDKVQQPIFDTVHVVRKELNNAQAWADFLSLQGVDKQKTLSVFNSFGVSSQMKQADTRVKNFQVTSTPQVIVDGRFRVNANSFEDTLRITQYLVDKVRADRATVKR